MNPAALLSRNKLPSLMYRTRDLVAGKMTAQQVAEAQRRAREWKPKSGENKGGMPIK